MTGLAIPVPLETRLGRLRAAARHPAAAWVMAGLSLCVLAGSVARWAEGPFNDFHTYYQAGMTVREGGPLYKHALDWRDGSLTIALPGADEKIAALSPLAAKGINLSPYVYPPGLAVALVPLTLLPLETARAIWLVLLVASACGTVYVLTRTLAPAAPRSSRLLATLVLTAALALFGPTRISVLFGQIDVLLVYMASLTFSAMVGGHDKRAGVLLGLAAAVKPTFGLLILFLLWKRAYRPFTISVAVCAIGILAPLAVLSPNTLLDFLDAARYWASPAFTVTPINQSLNGLFVRLFTVNPFTRPLFEAPELVAFLSIAVTALVLWMLTRSVLRSRAVSTERMALEYGLTVVAMLLISPLSEDLHYVYLAVPLLAVASAGGRRRRFGGAPFLLGALVLALFWSLPGLRRLEFPTPTPIAAPALLLTGAYVYGLVALTVLVLWALRSRGEAAAQRAPRSTGAQPSDNAATMLGT